MSAIGGYFGLELDLKHEYHKDAICLNTGRNALEYILLARKYKKIYIPFFTCEVIIETITKVKTSYQFYTINENFEPIFDFSLIGEDEAFLYTNYFGLKDDFINELASACKNLILDNAQSFYSKPINNIDTFYSPRKFFGVPDGGYLYTTKTMSKELEVDYSESRFKHLLQRHDEDAEMGYAAFQKNEKSLNNQPILAMSKLTKKILSSINYKEIEKKRQANFNYLASKLDFLNEMSFKADTNQVPMVYPFLTTKTNLKNKLIENQIYTSQYWKEVTSIVAKGSVEYRFATQLIPLPIDQRYNYTDLDKIIKIIINEYQGQ